MPDDRKQPSSNAQQHQLPGISAGVGGQSSGPPRSRPCSPPVPGPPTTNNIAGNMAPRPLSSTGYVIILFKFSVCENSGK